MRWPKSLPLSLANFHDERVKLAAPSLSIFFSLWPSPSIHDSSLFAYHSSLAKEQAQAHKSLDVEKPVFLLKRKIITGLPSYYLLGCCPFVEKKKIAYWSGIPINTCSGRTIKWFFKRRKIGTMYVCMQIDFISEKIMLRLFTVFWFTFSGFFPTFGKNNVKPLLL